MRKVLHIVQNALLLLSVTIIAFMGICQAKEALSSEPQLEDADHFVYGTVCDPLYAALYEYGEAAGANAMERYAYIRKCDADGKIVDEAGFFKGKIPSYITNLQIDSENLYGIYCENERKLVRVNPENLSEVTMVETSFAITASTQLLGIVQDTLVFSSLTNNGRAITLTGLTKDGTVQNAVSIAIQDVIGTGETMNPVDWVSVGSMIRLRDGMLLCGTIQRQEGEQGFLCLVDEERIWSACIPANDAVTVSVADVIQKDDRLLVCGACRPTAEGCIYPFLAEYDVSGTWMSYSEFTDLDGDVVPTGLIDEKGSLAMVGYSYGENQTMTAYYAEKPINGYFVGKESGVLTGAPLPFGDRILCNMGKKDSWERYVSFDTCKDYFRWLFLKRFVRYVYIGAWVVVVCCLAIKISVCVKRHKSAPQEVASR